MSQPATGDASAAAVRNPSLWMATSEFPDFPPLAADIAVPALVIGSGITGLTAARLLADEGLTVAVIDGRKLASGVTGFTTAKLTALQSTIYSDLSRAWGDEVARVYAAANQAAVEAVNRRAADDVIDCDLREESAYTYTESRENLPQIEAEVEAARRAGLDVVFTTESDLPYEIQGAVRLDHQARFHPRRFCLGLVRGLIRDGASIYENTRALDIDAGAGTVTTDRGTISADIIVVASHLPFVNTGGYFARMTASRSYALAFRSGDLPLQGMYISVDDPTRSVRAAGDGYTVIGGEGHPAGDDQDTTERYEVLETWARERFGTDDIDFRWSAQDYRSVDGLPYIGRLGSSGEVFMATGFAKWGMTNGTTAAQIMVDLAMGRPNPWAWIFDSKRLALKQAVPDVLSANVRVAKRLIGDRAFGSTVTGVDHLPPGSGDVVSIDGEKVAVFRTEDGLVHAVSAICTHLACQVALNTAERTWDCPCHGSRFDLDGRQIHGPAVEDLAPVDTASDPIDA